MIDARAPHDLPMTGQGATAPAHVRHALVDFINHGLLPFTGRARQADHIIGIWRGAIDAPGLRAILLLGEAGMGKSRLIEEVAARVLKLEGAVVHAKLFPESATSIVPLLARALDGLAAHPRSGLGERPQDLVGLLEGRLVVEPGLVEDLVHRRPLSPGSRGRRRRPAARARRRGPGSAASTPRT